MKKVAKTPPTTSAALPDAWRSLVPEGKALTVRVLDDIERQRAELEADLRGLRRSWRWYKNEYRGSEEQRAYWLARIEERGKAVKDELDALPPVYTIGAARRQDEQRLRRQLIEAIAWLVEQFNLPNTLTREQALTIVELIMDDYRHLRVQDVMIAFRRAVKGLYKPAYNRLDTATVMGWLTAYSEERMRAAEQRNYNEALALKDANASESIARLLAEKLKR